MKRVRLDQRDQPAIPVTRDALDRRGTQEKRAARAPQAILEKLALLDPRVERETPA